MNIKKNIREPDSFAAYLDKTFNRMDRPQSLWPGGFLPYSTYQKVKRQPPEPPKPESPQAKGGRARAAKMDAVQRSELARKAARARWAKPDGAHI